MSAMIELSHLKPEEQINLKSLRHLVQLPHKTADRKLNQLK